MGRRMHKSGGVSGTLTSGNSGDWGRGSQEKPRQGRAAPEPGPGSMTQRNEVPGRVALARLPPEHSQEGKGMGDRGWGWGWGWGCAGQQYSAGMPGRGGPGQQGGQPKGEGEGRWGKRRSWERGKWVGRRRDGA